MGDKGTSMSRYNDELPATYVERELSQFINKNQDHLNCTVGECILIMQATTAYCVDLLQGITTLEQKALVVDSTIEHTKKLMLAKVGVHEEHKEPKAKKTKNR
jgi:hypothetical protein